MKIRNVLVCFALFTGLMESFSSCRKGSSMTGSVGNDTTVNPVPQPFDINSIHDTYEDVAPFTYYPKWGPYNVHDPSIRKFGDYYYCFSTDVGYGIDVRPGIQIRKSKDLVEWTFVGWAFNGIPAMAAAFITQHGGTPNPGLWAPFIMKVGAEYRLYFSLSSATPRLSVIGLATAPAPEGPWTEKGIVVSSTDGNYVQTNAIDPTVLVTLGGQYWMYYGSAWDGIYILALDPSTGMAATAGDKGTRIANRGYTNGQYNGNIEGAEIIYNEKLSKYYLFIAYDWLQTKYNVRVCRADNPQGPFYDYDNVDANTDVDHGPMIVAPYQFLGHGGWQGTAHCSVFTDGNGQYFIAHQGRPAVNSYFMDLHVRKLFWTTDGWPVASPERFAWEKNDSVARDSLAGTWERIVLNYHVVPGYAAEQVSPDMQMATLMSIDLGGSLNGDAGSTWTYSAPWLQLNWSSGTIEKLYVQSGRDWENHTGTIIFTGLNSNGIAVWGKKN